ncbi:heterodisulfide reductase-related iron-sulfur binding cluster [Smaragdicoccus niigatensis]|uniref:heterodisulfide reductase-related iron-sulfur binding cluster n=1 Tax=Smaragdicoccus niigatensis TaxID=359359 RepID=UPI0012DE7DB8|nr:heterodisulfide reductase-related iron-sulfur binding cluster [Smaragdicoccus niigatensis]
MLGTLATVALAAQRGNFLYRLISSGPPATGRVTTDIPKRLTAELVEVAGQKKLLKWTVPGLAHFFTMYAFLIMSTVYIEAYGATFNEQFQLPLLRRIGVGDLNLLSLLGVAQDFIGIACILSLGVFALIRIKHDPEKQERKSRFYGSHLGGAWTILFMIFNVCWTMFFFRGAAKAAGNFDNPGAFFSNFLGDHVFSVFGTGPESANGVLDRIGLLGHIGVMLVFLYIVMHSKHLHIFTAPLNVGAKRLPNGLGPLLPVEANGVPIDFDDPSEDDIMGKGKVDDFTWKGRLDMLTCTECGRCQSQCPAWNTGKPLSPKLVIMNLRDHLFAKAPYVLGDKPMPEEGSVEVKGHAPHGHAVPEDGFERITGTNAEQALRPLVGDLESGGVIDPDVLWSCTNCGACVEQCPVDIEHIDHIVDMRRYQVMMESEFPGELGVLFRNLENKGNPWGQANSGRMDWAKGLGFDIPIWDGEPLAQEVEYIYWIGCAGSFDDQAKKTVRATAELFYRANVDFVVLGEQETCTGDSARRGGNEFLFQMLAKQAIELLDEAFGDRPVARKKIVTTCPHCMNALGREYPQIGGEYEVVHHTQLLNRLVRDGNLVPVKPADANGPQVTYHDPCFLGRHNKVYTPPRELIESSGMVHVEMERHGDRSFCCGAGGARMWMEEHIGERINQNRVDEAIATLDAAGSVGGTVAVGCPFCKVMVADGLTSAADQGRGVGVDVKDVSQLLLEGVKRGKTELPSFEPFSRTPGKPRKEEVTVGAPAAAEPKAEAPVAAAAPAAAAPAPATGLKPPGGLAAPGGLKPPGGGLAAPGGLKPPGAPAAPGGLKPPGGLAAPGGLKPPGGLAAPGGLKPPGGLAAPGGIKPPGAPAAPAAPAADAPAAEAPAAPKPAAGGLGLKGGLGSPGGLKPPAGLPAPGGLKPPAAPAAPAAEEAPKAEEPEAPAEEAPVAEAPATEAPAAEAPKPAGLPKPGAAGLGLKGGLKPPGQ